MANFNIILINKMVTINCTCGGVDKMVNILLVKKWNKSDLQPTSLVTFPGNFNFPRNRNFPRKSNFRGILISWEIKGQINWFSDISQKFKFSQKLKFSLEVSFSGNSHFSGNKWPHKLAYDGH